MKAFVSVLYLFAVVEMKTYDDKVNGDIRSGSFEEVWSERMDLVLPYSEQMKKTWTAYLNAETDLNNKPNQIINALTDHVKAISDYLAVLDKDAKIKDGLFAWKDVISAKLEITKDGNNTVDGRKKLRKLWRRFFSRKWELICLQEMDCPATEEMVEKEKCMNTLDVEGGEPVVAFQEYRQALLNAAKDETDVVLKTLYNAHAGYIEALEMDEKSLETRTMAEKQALFSWREYTAIKGVELPKTAELVLADQIIALAEEPYEIEIAIDIAILATKSLAEDVDKEIEPLCLARIDQLRAQLGALTTKDPEQWKSQLKVNAELDKFWTVKNKLIKEVKPLEMPSTEMMESTAEALRNTSCNRTEETKNYIDAVKKAFKKTKDKITSDFYLAVMKYQKATLNNPEELNGMMENYFAALSVWATNQRSRNVGLPLTKIKNAMQKLANAVKSTDIENIKTALGVYKLDVNVANYTKYGKLSNAWRDVLQKLEWTLRGYEFHWKHLKNSFETYLSVWRKEQIQPKRDVIINTMALNVNIVKKVLNELFPQSEMIVSNCEMDNETKEAWKQALKNAKVSKKNQMIYTFYEQLKWVCDSETKLHRTRLEYAVYWYSEDILAYAYNTSGQSRQSFRKLDYMLKNWDNVETSRHSHQDINNLLNLADFVWNYL